ncbi:MAG: SDR family oxidoreductase [Acidimicrobiales bacterium]|jgi:NAD(P)-dependent dehydrogenase (short-subunit alcohol dehydrogenase family)
MTIDPLESFRLDSKVAVVTGASVGLGRRFAQVLHGAGATVVVGARRLDRLESLASELGERCIPVACDVTVGSQCEALIARAVEAGDGSFDVLVNNAGISVIGPAETERFEDFTRVVDVNLNAVFRLCQLAYEPMVAGGGGSIVNIASILGLVAGTPVKQAGYCAAKAGVVNLTRELGAQWGRRGVRVNAIAPGWFPSEMTAVMWGDESSERFVATNTAVGRAGEDHELDGALLFLASEASSYVIGQTIPVDGGWTIR